ncbi:MAG: M23 family metallopeptidase [Bacteroidales bacterium]|nr:M23 family metallopeptidase [Bacteroidales bacterium]
MGRQNLKEALEKLLKTYRISIVENDTHVSVKTLFFSKLGFYAFTVSTFLAILLLVYLAFVFTPLKTIIPGYPDAHSRRVAVENAIKIDSLESLMTKWDLYANNLALVLAGEQTIRIDSMVLNDGTKYLSAKSIDELGRSDSLLRETVMQEEQFEVGGTEERNLPIEGMHFFTPIKGVVSQGFDQSLHPAIDITAPSGSMVCSIYEGVVVFTGWDEGRGNVIIIQHPNNLISQYGHNQKLLKKLGDTVSAGTPIALVGNTGSLTTGDHLHFELWSNGEPVNPQKYISL